MYCDNVSLFKQPSCKSHVGQSSRNGVGRAFMLHLQGLYGNYGMNVVLLDRFPNGNILEYCRIFHNICASHIPPCLLTEFLVSYLSKHGPGMHKSCWDFCNVH